jgi:hypothetical protein
MDFIESDTFFDTSPPQKKTLIFSKSGGPKHDQRALKRPHEGPPKARQGLRNVGFPSGKPRFTQTVPRVSVECMKIGRSSVPKRGSERDPKKLISKPLFDALKMLNLMTFIMGF